MVSDLNKLAREILSKNQYMTIGTSDEDGNAWVSPVVYAPDEKYNLYFISLPDSKHSNNIVKNPDAVVAIFDSHQPFGEGVGLQIEGVIQKVPYSKTLRAINIYVTRKWPHSNEVLKRYLSGFKSVLRNKSYRAYVFIPKEVWMNDPSSKIDIRVKVELNKS